MAEAFERVPAPGSGGSDTRESILDEVERWVSGAPIAALLAAFGAEPPVGPTRDRLDWLEQFSAENWDFRAGKERNLAAAQTFAEPVQATIFSVATALGMVSTQPPRAARYDHVLILGGLVRACLLRPRYAADLLRQGVRASAVAALTAFRPLGGDEPALVRAAGITGEPANEMEAMQEGLMRAFGLDPAAAHDVGSGEGFATELVRSWRQDDTTVELVVAPSPEPETRRANSADTYAYWADRHAHLQPGAQILLITSAIYVPFQGCDAVRVLALPRGCSVETVGVDVTSTDLGALQQQFTPANYLQEIRSAVRSVRSLHEAASR